MIQHAGWYLPGHERHLPGWFDHPKNKTQVESGRVMYQATKQRAAMGYCKQFRTAVDIGAHCGLHAFYLAQRFQAVHCFEPVQEHRDCFALNVEAANVVMHACALGAEPGRVAMATEQGSSGNSHVAGSGDIELRTLDSFELADVDYIKLDTEGFELYILQGAVQTLKRCRPVMMVEQKPHVIGNFGFKSPEAIDFLKSLGAHVLQEISGDYLMGWPECSA